MPVSYRIDTARHLVYVRWTGSVTFNEAAAHADELRTDADFQPDMAQLSDTRGMRLGATKSAGSDAVRGLAQKPRRSGIAKALEQSRKKKEFAAMADDFLRSRSYEG